MNRSQAYRLFNSFLVLVILAIVASLVAVQWRHQALPLAAIAAVLAITIFKARLVALDFLGLRGSSSASAKALIAWPIAFAALAAGKALFITFAPL